jgi:glucose/mannose transport system substrate-binding protein
MGGETWQHSGAFAVLLLNSLGSDLYHKLYRDKDAAVARSPEVAKVFETFRALKQYSDEGGANRNWNDTTNLVITDKAGLQIMGDWARGEFAVAGEKPGVDYACIAGPSEKPYLSTGGDIFLFPKQDDPEVEAAQLKMASMMVNPRVQALFNLAKGSLPVRDDVDLALADECMKIGIELLKNPDTVVGDPVNFITEDTDGQIRDLFAEFWADDTLSVADAQERFAQIIDSAK